MRDAVLQPDLPFAMQLELTSRCNLRCVMCPLTTGTSSTSGAPGAVSGDTWERILPVARRCQQVFVAGYGEPFTNPRCVDLLRDLDEHGVETTIATNGLVVTPAIASALASLRHLSRVNVSIDSPDPDVYRALRGSNLRRALQGLRNLLDALGPGHITVSSVLMTQNARSLLAFPALLAELGVRYYDVQGVMDYNEVAQASSLLGRADLAEVIDALRDECERHGVYLLVGSEDRLRLELRDPVAARQRYHDRPGADAHVTRQCMVPWEVPFVDKDGSVFACCYAASSNARVLGNVHERPLETIWVDEPFRQFRLDILDGTSTPEPCRSCTVATLGEHPLRTWSATIDPASVRVTRRRVTFRAVNTGTRPWTRTDLVRAGTRDGDSPIAHRSWLLPTRPGTFEEDVVLPGASATFSFAVEPVAHAVTQHFHLVVEDVLWIPGASVAVSVPARRLPRLPTRHAPGDPSVAGFVGESVVDGVSVDGTTVRVRVRNTGTRKWHQSDHVRLGTASPRDATSPLAHPTWLQPNRVGTFTEATVAPGDVATFEFEIATAQRPTTQRFQVVAEGYCWLSGTTVEVTV